MIPHDRIERFKLLLPLTGGNEAAATLLADVGALFRLADNIADGDEPAVQEGMANVLTLALETVPNNPFYDQHRHLLRHFLASAVTQWQISNRFHGSDDVRAQTFGFVLREAGEAFTMQVCALCRGWDEAADVYEQIFKLVHHERTETVATWAGEKQ